MSPSVQTVMFDAEVQPVLIRQMLIQQIWRQSQLWCLQLTFFLGEAD
ncbi:MAG: hypothetical protein JKY85_08215 [Porticoccus sp.]|nr:hypothetical protein [Porticoccus sp.]